MQKITENVKEQSNSLIVELSNQSIQNPRHLASKEKITLQPSPSPLQKGPTNILFSSDKLQPKTNFLQEISAINIDEGEPNPLTMVALGKNSAGKSSLVSKFIESD